MLGVSLCDHISNKAVWQMSNMKDVVEATRKNMSR